MTVPAEIRAVSRPKNTVVCNTGRPGPKQYPVRERTNVIYVPGGNPQPHNGRVIGHIIGSKFVPIHQRVGSNGPDCLSYGSAALIREFADDLEEDLNEVMDSKDAQTVLVAAMLRVLRPGIPLNRYSTHYNLSFISVFYPGLGFSSHVVEDLEKRLGQDGESRLKFFERRFKRVLPGSKVAIDGTLKQDTSEINSLSAYSHKARVKGCRDISVLYAYDIDKKEPICSQVFPGNSIDAVSYREFIKTNKIKQGIIIADKGFPPSKITQELKDYPDLHFLSPIKLNDRRIAKYQMLEPANVVPGLGKSVTCKKQALPNKHFLYAFRDVRLAGAEDVHYLERALKNGDYDSKKYEIAKDRFGVIVFESDQDMSPTDIYRCYDERWELELVFRYYKSNIGLDKTGAQADFEVIGSEFINFIASILTCRIISKMCRCGVLEKLSYKTVMHDLATAFRKVGHESDATENDEYWVHTLPKVMESLVALGLAKRIVVEPVDTSKKRRKTKVGSKTTSEEPPAAATEGAPATVGTPSEKKVTKRRYAGPRDPDFVGPHLPWGRPRKAPPAGEAPKKKHDGPGRPRVRPEFDHPKRRRGRPPKVLRSGEAGL